MNLATSIKYPVEMSNEIGLAFLRENFMSQTIDTIVGVPGYYNIANGLAKDKRTAAALLLRTFREGVHPPHPYIIARTAQLPFPPAPENGALNHYKPNSDHDIYNSPPSTTLPSTRPNMLQISTISQKAAKASQTFGWPHQSRGTNHRKRVILEDMTTFLWTFPLPSNAHTQNTARTHMNHGGQVYEHTTYTCNITARVLTPIRVQVHANILIIPSHSTTVGIRRLSLLQVYNSCGHSYQSTTAEV